jgi:hypothetical protein
MYNIALCYVGERAVEAENRQFVSKKLLAPIVNYA